MLHATTNFGICLENTRCTRHHHNQKGNREIMAEVANWDLEADVIVIGSGAAGLPAAIRAVEGGASVIVVEANYDVGGHAILSGGNVPLGGGTSAQRKFGIEDSADVVFSDLTDWSIVQP